MGNHQSRAALTKMHASGKLTLSVLARLQYFHKLSTPNHIRAMPQTIGIGAASSFAYVDKPNHPEADSHIRIFNSAIPKLDTCGNSVPVRFVQSSYP